MTWYKAGTITVTQNSNAVLGSGTKFIANSRVGDAFRGPDGRWYEVINIASDTALAISPNYQGPDMGGGLYAIAPMQGYVKDTADALRAVSFEVGTALDGLDDSVEQAAASAVAAAAANAESYAAYEAASTKAAEAAQSNSSAYSAYESADAAADTAVAAQSSAQTLATASAQSAANAEIARIAAAASAAIAMPSRSGGSTDPNVVEMHFGTLRGRGWFAGEPGGIVSTTTTAVSTVGTNTLPVASVAGYVVGQLMCWVASDGQYYTGVIIAITGLNISLDRFHSVEVPIGAGVYNFYNNNVHPNTHGYFAIADDAIRQMGSKFRTAYEINGYGTLVGDVVSGAGAVLSPNAGDDYTNPGGAAVAADSSTHVEVSGAGLGASTPAITLPAGSYRARVILAPGFGTAPLFVTTQETTAEGATFQTNFKNVVRRGGVEVVDISFKSRKGSTMKIQVATQDGGASAFDVGKITVSRVMEQGLNFNFGKHVLLGDSWFSTGELMYRLQQRMPSATFVNKGHGGDQILDLYLRMDADVKPENPDFTWIMVGTNNIFAGTSPALFDVQLNLVVSKLNEYDSQTIVFTPSVCDLNYVPAPGPRLAMSRAYAIRCGYQEAQ